MDTPLGGRARRRRPSAPRPLRRALLAVAAAQTLATTVRVLRELIAHRAASARLGSEYTTIGGVTGGGGPASAPAEALALHSRTGEGAEPGLAPVVLVPGFGIGSSYLVPLAARLARDTRVYAVEPPGHGRSEHDLRPLTVPELAEALAAWMDRRYLRAAVLVGHSLGAQVAAETAVRRPDLVAGLVLVGPTTDPGARTAARILTRAQLLTGPFERPTYAVWTSLDYPRAGAAVLATEMREMIDHHIEDVLPRLDRPVRVVRGARDRLVSQDWAEKVARLAGAPAPTAVPRWGHAVHYDDPEAVARVTLELLAEVAEQGPPVSDEVRAAAPAPVPESPDR
ncbi:MAG TPA: alpha/beta fold hydrolase [Pseudonocardia sp.]|nr:alpha/beta fold hydrolase [Pseudonocardia sp.]